MPNVGRPYLAHQAEEVQPASSHTLAVVTQATKGYYTEATPTSAYMLTARVSPSAPRVQHDNTEFRATRSPSPKIAGVYPEIPFSAEGHLQPAGTLSTGAAIDTGDDPPQGDLMLRNLWGSVSLADSQNRYAISSVTSASCNRDQTVFVLPANALAVNDIIELQTLAANADTSGLANLECRRITAIAGGVTITVKPGFSKEPIAGDSIQGVRMYKPTKPWNQWLSARVLEGAVGKQLIDGKAGAFSITFSPEEPIKLSVELTFMKMLRSGIDMIRGTGGADTLAATSPITADVWDASKFELNTFVDMVKVDADPASGTYDTVLATEVKAEVTARNTTSTPNTLTLTRGTGPVSQTGGTQNLKASSLLANHVAGPYNLTTNKNLKFNVDGKPSVTFDMSLPTAPAVIGAATATELAANGNKQLSLHKFYGYNTSGRVPVGWGTTGFAVFVNAAGTLTMVSQIEGTNSKVQVETASTLDLSTTLFVGPFENYANSEIQILPHAPVQTEQGVEQHGYTTLIGWGSYCIGVNNFSIGMTNNPRVVREMKNNPRPISIIAGKMRTYTISCELLQRQDAGAFFEDESTGVLKILHIQTMGGDIGDIVGFDAGQAKIDQVVTGGDDEITTMTLTIAVQGSADDEMIAFFG